MSWEGMEREGRRRGWVQTAGEERAIDCQPDSRERKTAHSRSKHTQKRKKKKKKGKKKGGGAVGKGGRVGVGWGS